MATHLPPVPPRPYSYNSSDYPDYPDSSNAPPPVPPLPPNYIPDIDYTSLPHFQDPLVAPRPQRLNQDVPADVSILHPQDRSHLTDVFRKMARTLDEQAAYARYTSPPQPSRTPQPPQNGVNLAPGFMMPSFRGPSPGPPPAQQNSGGWNSPSMPPPFPTTPRADSLSASMASLSFSPAPGGPRARVQSTYGSSTPPYPAPLPIPQQQTGSSVNGAPPSLTAPLPTISALLASQQAVQNPSTDPASKIAWCRDVLSLANRATQTAAGGSNGSSGGQSGTDPIPGPARITDPNLRRLADVAVPLVLGIANSAQQQQNPDAPSPKLAPPVAEAVYLRAVISSAGSFPQFTPQNSRTAFRDFETAARSGFHASWFRLGRDYENFGDDMHARDCFERGLKYNVESCIYVRKLITICFFINLRVLCFY